MAKFIHDGRGLICWQPIQSHILLCKLETKRTETKKRIKIANVNKENNSGLRNPWQPHKKHETQAE